MAASETSNDQQTPLLAGGGQPQAEDDGPDQRQPDELPPRPQRPQRRQLLGIFLSAMCNGINITLPFCIAVYIVRGFGVHDEVHVGKMTGLLTSLYQLGQFCTSFLWGKISDRIGRKTVVVTGNISNAVLVVLFGMSADYPTACTIRFLAGALNGIPGSLRTMAGEISQPGNQASALLYLSMGFGLGSSIGPSLGAIFSDPCLNYGESFPLCGPGQLFSERKYVLPCIATFGVTSFSIVASFFMKETLQRKPSEAAGQLLLGAIGEPQGQGHVTHPSRPRALPPVPSLGYLTDAGEEVTPVHWYAMADVRMALAGVAIVAFVNTMWDEVTPIFASSLEENGGLELRTSQLGIPLTLGGCSLFLYAMLGYKRVQRALGVKTLACVGLRLYTPLAIAFPSTSLFMPRQRVALCMLCIAQVLRVLTGTNVSTSATMLVNMSAPRSHLGEVNGFGMMLVALMRALGPALGGVMWSYTLALDMPYHQYCTYAVVAMVAMVTSFLYGKALGLPNAK